MTIINNTTYPSWISFPISTFGNWDILHNRSVIHESLKMRTTIAMAPVLSFTIFNAACFRYSCWALSSSCNFFPISQVVGFTCPESLCFSSLFLFNASCAFFQLFLAASVFASDFTDPPFLLNVLWSIVHSLICTNRFVCQQALFLHESTEQFIHWIRDWCCLIRLLRSSLEPLIPSLIK